MNRPGPRRSLETRFWEYVDKSDANGCWLWTSALMFKGYGRISVKSRSQAAHRISYQLHCGPIPAGLFVMHRCDNRRCVRPDHLFLGTAADNTADMMAKQRHVPAGLLGEKHWKTHLTEGDVMTIRQLRAGGVKPRVLAARYGISSDGIYQIVTGKSWRHLPIMEARL